MLPVIGQVLRIRFMEKPNAGVYKTTVIAFDKDALITTVPVFADKASSQFQPGTRIVIQYHAQDGALLFFKTAVKEYSIESPQLELFLPKPQDIHREQRRQFVRVPVSLPIRIDWHHQNAVNQFDLTMRDLSGGGVSVLLPPAIAFPIGNEVRARFTLPHRDIFVDVKCQVVRVSERNEFQYAVCSMKFADITESMRQKIIQYTFVRQRELLILKQDISRI